MHLRVTWHLPPPSIFFFFNDTAPTAIYTLSLHDALPISRSRPTGRSTSPTSRTSTSRPSRSGRSRGSGGRPTSPSRSEEHTSELQSLRHLVCRLLLEKKKKNKTYTPQRPTSTIKSASRAT